ncbi:hypothetical protein J6E39_09240 [bacterium]|nr:hypothetical protein [bacterium]
MANPVSSLIFAYRNTDKTSNGDIGRAPVAIGQATNLFNEIAKFDNMIGAGAKSALSIFCDSSKHNKAIDYAGKGLKFASEHVNPLICASSVLKTATSDDKVQTGLTEICALSGMFLGEGLAKQYLEKNFTDKNVEKYLRNLSQKGICKNLAEKILNSNSSSKAATILRGLLFVCASLTSYAAGEKLGKEFAGDIASKAGIKKIDQKA